MHYIYSPQYFTFFQPKPNPQTLNIITRHTPPFPTRPQEMTSREESFYLTKLVQEVKHVDLHGEGGCCCPFLTGGLRGGEQPPLCSMRRVTPFVQPMHILFVSAA